MDFYSEVHGNVDLISLMMERFLLAYREGESFCPFNRGACIEGLIECLGKEGLEMITIITRASSFERQKSLTFQVYYDAFGVIFFEYFWQN